MDNYKKFYTFTDLCPKDNVTKDVTVEYQLREDMKNGKHYLKIKSYCKCGLECPIYKNADNIIKF